MRILLVLAAAAGAAAIAAPAPARPAGKFTGPGAGTPGAWAAGGGDHRARRGWLGLSRPSLGRDRRDRHRGDRRPDRDGLLFYDGFGIDWPAGGLDPHGNGFFAGGGGEVRMRGNRPHYDYDRSYPYEWASAAGGRGRRWEVAFVSEPPPRCTVENGVRVCRGW